MHHRSHHIKLLLIALCLSLTFLVSCSSGEDDKAAIETAWGSSAHADEESRSFTRWNDDDPPEIPENCAKCHSTTGYLDYLGADGSTAGQVNMPAPVGTTVECDACHNDVSRDKDVAVMPSGIELDGLGSNSNCFECHQGRASSVQLSDAIQGMEPDSVNKEISATSIHNNPAGPNQYGTEAKGGYEYAGKSYLQKYGHVVQFDTCISCHDSHSLHIDPERCSACHLGVKSTDDFARIRTSSIDYDGDRDTAEGIAGEIETLEKKLLRSIEIYTAVTDGVEPLQINGRFLTVDGETYSTWTPRLLKAAYNYQFSTTSTGGYAHNAQYLIQLLHDSIEDIGGNTTGLTRPPA